MRWCLALGAAFFAALAFGDAALAETRVALVIGNSAYRSVPALPNPRRDAGRVAASLGSAGFQSVTVVDDASRADLITALNRFSDAAERADWAIVYYAGHGIEIGGANYLIPVDARLKSDRDITDEAISLDRVLESIEPAHKLRVVVLDACRDNPFAGAMRRTIATRSVGRGLAQVEPEGGTLVAFAAKHGQTALDGDGANSPFAEALARRIVTPGVEINKLFRLVRDDVMAATGRRQEPFVYGSLPGEDFFFVGNSLATMPPVAGTDLPAKLPSTAPTPIPPVAQKLPQQVAALPPAQDLPPPLWQPQVEQRNGPVNAPLVGFSRSNAGWQATVSLPEPAISVSWRFGNEGDYRETGYLDVIDQRIGRRMPSSSIPLDPDTPAGTINLRYVDAAGVTVGPFPVPFDPRAELIRDQQKIIEMVGGSWLSFRDFNGVLLYYTALVSYRCAIKELRIGLDKAEPDRVIPLPPCDEANPFAIPGNFTPYLKAPPGTRSASARIVYRDGTLSPVKMFRR
ncbi:caspase family protein [Methylobacterium gnaphalii]|uniref:Caspase family p20 domain-containing protein n=1 Tax=Methylobacterium gnaphalii TaxID=1010610 RepID=A0A512JQ67_9HYPH|nr:caspase family protein [Methylobacterium gnaphalii]GEP12087.1 hypothetical protein MGN01_39320 [Methylobacterium gnaphalii]GJD71021.1 hypothetical protein MMMDOFMJ_3975 [Methylobacterium gnaphalii]GLS48204.1 hypothetical protein GCM10007885_10480 [Methylobacterium gnaphalii]